MWINFDDRLSWFGTIPDRDWRTDRRVVAQNNGMTDTSLQQMRSIAGKNITQIIVACYCYGYFWAYNAAHGRCDVRPFTSAAMSTFWSVWSWTTEMFIFLVVPIAALNLLRPRHQRSTSNLKHISVVCRRLPASSQQVKFKTARFKVTK